MTNYQYLKDNISIVELGRYLGLEKERAVKGGVQGTFKGERTPALTLYTDNNRFKDFSTGDSGSVIDLVSYVLGYDTPKAAEYLNEYLGNTKGLKFNASSSFKPARSLKSSKPSTMDVVDIIRANNEKFEKESQIFDDKIINKRCEGTRIYEFLFANCSLSDEARTYLRGRGLADNQIDSFGFFTIDNPEEIKLKLLGNFGLEELRDAGLINLDETCTKRNDKYKFNFKFIFWKPGLIIIPYFLLDSKIGYLQARDKHPAETGHKYTCLWGAKSPYTIFQNNNKVLYISEGIFDAIHVFAEVNEPYCIKGYCASEVFDIDENYGIEVDGVKHSEIPAIMACGDVGELKKYAVHIYKRIKKEGDYYGIKKIVLIPDHDVSGLKVVNEVLAACSDRNVLTVLEYPEKYKDYNDYVLGVEKEVAHA